MKVVVGISEQLKKRYLPCIENYFSQTGIKIIKKINEFAACAVRLLYLKTCSFRHSNENISKQNSLLFLIAIYRTQPYFI